MVPKQNKGGRATGVKICTGLSYIEWLQSIIYNEHEIDRCFVYYDSLYILPILRDPFITAV